MENDVEFLNTYRTGSPITFSLGMSLDEIVHNNFSSETAMGLRVSTKTQALPGNVTEGLEEGLKGMKEGGRRLIAVPPGLGAWRWIGLQGARSALGVTIPGNAQLYYDVELLRCNRTAEGSQGLICCPQKVYPCPKPKEAVQATE
eukprot:scaffold540144_cov45-Prasinocladus_malaysianus.AAC.1